MPRDMSFHGETDDWGIEKDPELFAASIITPEPPLSAIRNRIKKIISTVVFRRPSGDIIEPPSQEAELL